MHGWEEVPNRHHARELDNISDEEVDPPGDLDEDERGYGVDRRADGFGDFIETDESSDEGGRMGSGDERISRCQRGRRLVDTEVLGLGDGAMNDMGGIIGIADYEDALVLETDTADVEERAQDLQPKDVFEPSELQERLLTDEDNVIRWRDQENPSKTWLYREDLLEDGSWIAQTLLVNKEIDPELEGPFIEAVRSVLKFLVVDNYEVPFIYQQRKDYLIHIIKIPRRNFSDGELPYDLHTEKLLFEKDLWAILDLDLKFRAFLQKRYSFINLWSNLQKKMIQWWRNG
jgi:transcription elongation factor SPT6